MQSHRSTQQNSNAQKLLKLSHKDFEKVSQWYQATKYNYFKQSQYQQLRKEQFRETHLRVYFSQIYLADSYLHSHLDLLRNLNYSPLSIIGGILKIQDQQLQGKPYENKNINAHFDMNTKSILLREEMNLCTYTLQTKQRDSLVFLQFALTNSQGQSFKLGRLQVNINSNLNQISELAINNKSKQKVAFIQTIIEKQPIKDLPRLIPPNVIIDQRVKIPAVKLMEMKNRRQPFVLETKSKMKLIEVKITIKNVNKLMQKIQRNNPFLSLHYENVEITSINYKLKIGSHNSWKFIDMKDETNIIALKQLKFPTSKSDENQLQLVSKFQKGYLNKTYFQSQSCVFAVLLYAQIAYKYEGFAVEQVIENLGWCIVVNKLYEPKIKYQSFLEIHNSFPGYEVNIPHEGIKFCVEIDNPQHKNHRKKIQDDFSKQACFDEIFINEQAGNLTKTIFVKRQVTERSTLLESKRGQKSIGDTAKELQHLMIEVESQIKKIKRRIKISGHFINPSPKSSRQNKQRDWQNLLKLQNKHVRLGIKLISMIPGTDQSTYKRAEYYLPIRFKTKLHMLRKSLQIQGQFVDNHASWNVPVFIKSNKEYNFMEALIKDRTELRRVVDSPIIVSVWDMENDIFYGKGSISVMDMFLSSCQQAQQHRFQINLINSTNNNKMGILVIQTSITLRSADTSSSKRQVHPIKKQAILQSLPMKQRLMMRISNYNKCTTQMQTTAIAYYKQKTMPLLVTQITNNQLNNISIIEYQLAQARYHLVQFRNSSQSQNNIFTFIIRGCEFAQIVTDQQQYKRYILSLNNSNNINTIIPYNKIQYRSNSHVKDGGHYRSNNNDLDSYISRIGHNQTVGILVKVLLMQWSPKIKQQTNFYLDIQRNTIPVLTHKFKLSFHLPVIHATYTFYQINQNLSKGINIHLPPQIINTYEQLSSFSSNLLIKNKPKLQVKLITKDTFKSPHRLEFICQGKKQLSQFQQKIQNILIQINLMDGEFIEVQFGQMSLKNISIDPKANPHLLNTILIIPDKNITKSIQSKHSAFFISDDDENQIKLTICSFDTNLQNIVINFYDLKNQVQYKYLLKLLTRINLKPILINIENFIGEKIILQCSNPYVSTGQFVIISTCASSIQIDRQIITIQPHSEQKVVLQLTSKLYQKCYIVIYDDCFTLIQLFQIQQFNHYYQQRLNLLNVQRE